MHPLMPLVRELSALQAEAEEHARRSGGYAPPFAGLARLFAATTALAGASLEEGKAAECLAELFLLTTCLANQYSIDLEKTWENLKP